MVVQRAQGLNPRQPALPDGGSSETALHSERSLFVHVSLWPYSLSGESYDTAVSNQTLLPSWEQSFTFIQAEQRAKRVCLRLWDVTDPSAPQQLGTALVPTPGAGAAQVNVLDRSGGKSADIVDGWFPVVPGAQEGDYTDSRNATAAGEILVRVSFAERQAKSSYCEAIRPLSPVAQPADSYSNALFLLTGLHILTVAATDTSRIRHARAAAFAAGFAGDAPEPQVLSSAMQALPVFSLINGLTQFFAGLCSFLFHASMALEGQVLDMAGVYMLLITPVLYILLRLGAFGRPGTQASSWLFLASAGIAAWAVAAFKWKLEVSAIACRPGPTLPCTALSNARI